jgi:hypothetical protein
MTATSCSVAPSFLDFASLHPGYGPAIRYGLRCAAFTSFTSVNTIPGARSRV